MTKEVKISQDERYPFFYVNDTFGQPVDDVPSDTLSRWSKVMEAFEEAQDEMEAIFNEAAARNARLAAIKKAEKAVREAQEKLDALRVEDMA